MKLDRRNFLHFMIGAAGGFMLTPVNWKLMDDVAIWTQNWSWVPVPEDGARAYANTTCQVCGGGCGIKVRLIDGQRAVKIEGNPNNPLNRGGLCAWGAAGLQYLYLDDNRVKSPMKRNRKTGVWTKLSWEEALKMVAGELKKLAARPQEVALLSGRKRSTMARLLKQFMTAYGSPNYIELPDGGDVQLAASRLALGQSQRYGFDLERAEVVLSFEAALLEGWGSPVRMMRAFETWRSGPAQKRTKLIQVEPRASLTASKADLWLAAKPGTETALALGLAQVLIASDLISPQAASAPGFDQFKARLDKDYTPDKVAALTGLKKEQITAAAKA
ncbi:MAG: molybdopterin-dependent oxidoreductase, partial [Deltaproteobacteria bacterium]|nr:molybdopterin-dependent oxidoreductase [Deltaproteobacteria bacterium]